MEEESERGVEGRRESSELKGKGKGKGRDQKWQWGEKGTLTAWLVEGKEREGGGSDGGVRGRP